MKYKLTEETKQIDGLTLYRIEALKDFGDIKRGDKGGWIEKEDNLSQDDNAWVSGDTELNTGYCFACKNKDWKVTEVSCGDSVLLARDCIEPKEELAVPGQFGHKDYGSQMEFNKEVIGVIHYLLQEVHKLKEENKNSQLKGKRNRGYLS